MPRVRRGRLWRRDLAGIALAFMAWALAAAPASATVLPPSSQPLPGSTFQGADGNQADAPPLVDWQAAVSTGRFRHSPDPNDEDSAFTGGSKENEPGEWGLTRERGGVNPAKDNIFDAWSAVRQPGGNTFLYLSFTRQAAEGTTYLAFELNHDARLWFNGRARVPCRRTGDVLVSYRAHGNDVNVVLQRWVTTLADPASGCAEKGRLDDYTGLTPNVDAQGAVNDAAIASYLPGFYQTAVLPRGFGEAALNLARLVEQGFGDHCLSFRSVWMHSRSSTSEQSNMQDYVAPRRLDVRTCAASGTKFFDRDADGVRDRGDPGIPRFVIFADYDDDGRLDRGEPRTVSDRRGRYVLYDIRPPDGTYMLRETLLTRRSRTTRVAEDWRCSRPNAATPGGTGSAPDGRFPCGWGPIDVNQVPNARGRDFGNWFPARLTVEKELEPADDPGRFDLLVNGRVVLAAAGDGASTTISVPPGVYDVSERPAAGTDAAAYRSSVECRRNPTRRGGRRRGRVFQNIALFAGDRGTCTFRNVRPGYPAIAIRKVGPAVGEAGDTLRYTFYVTNPGDLPFRANVVRVSDPACDARPELVRKRDGSGRDDSPRTLDPGDTWVYRCSNRTRDPGADCEPSRVDNTGTVTGSTGGRRVEDDDSISTVLLCPDRPRPPTPRPPTPGPSPGPVVPPGPRPPNAGDAGVASFLFRQATRRCIATRVPRVNFSGTRIRRLRVYANGRLRRALTVRTLQRRVTPRVTLAPGRYRVTVRVDFQPGSGSPPLTSSRFVRICRSTPARFTG